MDLTGDELAAIADLFGGLTRDELGEALEELAFKRGTDLDDRAVNGAIADALDEYSLVAVDRDDERLLVPGPAAFPDLPEGAEDLPHIMDVSEREIDRETAGDAARDRLLSDAKTAIQAGDEARIADLLDVSYDLEAWAPVDLEDVRELLDAAQD